MPPKRKVNIESPDNVETNKKTKLVSFLCSLELVKRLIYQNQKSDFRDVL